MSFNSIKNIWRQLKDSELFSELFDSFFDFLGYIIGILFILQIFSLMWKIAIILGGMNFNYPWRMVFVPGEISIILLLFCLSITVGLDYKKSDKEKNNENR